MASVFKLFSSLILALFALQHSCLAQNEDSNEFFTITEEMPEYPGGDAELMVFFATTTKYPKEAIKDEITGVSYISYVVEKDGSVGDVHVSKGSHPLLDAEAVRVVKKLSGYKPGTQRGKPVRVKFTVPLRFTLELSGNAPQHDLVAAVKAFDKGDEIKGMKSLEKAIKKGKRWYIDAYKFRARKHQENGNFIQAQQDYQTALLIDPTRADLWKEKAKCQFALGGLNEALESLETSAKCNPFSSSAHAYSGDYCLSAGMFEKAESHYDLAIEIDKYDGYLFYQRGKSRAARENMEGACKDWRQAVLLKEKDAQKELDEYCESDK